MESRDSSPAAIASPISAAPPETSARASRRSAAATSSAARNIDKVYYGAYEIKAWYFSPYPVEDDHADDLSPLRSASWIAPNKRVASGLSSPLTLSNGHNHKRSRRDLSTHGRDTPLIEAGSPIQSNYSLHPGGALGASARDAPALQAVLDGGSAGSPARKAQPPLAVGSRNGASAHVPSRNLWICEGCFKYMKTYSGYTVHKKQCDYSHPPGRKVYQRGAHIIWEVDGADAKLYAQNLSLFGKLFIDHKTIYFDVEPFLFYVLTEAGSSSFDHAIGYFSKEKQSYDDYNLACIITFPPFQRKSFGTMMIEFSYALSAKQGMLGTPERPLSDLGLKGYVSFWSAVVLRSLEELFGASAPNKTHDQTEAASHRAKRVLATLEKRCAVMGFEADAMDQDGLDALRQALRLNDDDKEEEEKKRRRAAKGFAGSPPLGGERKGITIRLRRKVQDDEHEEHLGTSPVAASVPSAASTRSLRDRRTSQSSRAMGSPLPLTLSSHASSATGAEHHVHPSLSLAAIDDPVTMETTLELLSRVTHLRTEDIAVALADCGLLTLRMASIGDRADNAIVLTQEAVQKVLTERRVRPAVLDPSCLVL